MASWHFSYISSLAKKNRIFFSNTSLHLLLARVTGVLRPIPALELGVTLWGGNTKRKCGIIESSFVVVLSMTWSISYWDWLNNDWPNKQGWKQAKSKRIMAIPGGPRGQEREVLKSPSSISSRRPQHSTPYGTQKNHFCIHDGPVWEYGNIWDGKN